MAYKRSDDIVRNSIRNNGGEYRKTQKSGKHFGIKFIIIFVSVFSGIAVFAWGLSAKYGSQVDDIGYESGTVASDEAELQKFADHMKNEDGKVSLEYKNAASSSDGKKFNCYIANSMNNKYDMYLGIYSDSTCEEELYLSKLLKPGTGIEEFECNKKLSPGNYSVILVFTLVGEDHKTIKSQTPIAYTLNVKE